MRERTGIAVVGAGPCGLGVGIAARQAGVPCLIFDKGSLTDALVRFPRNMTFFSTADRLELRVVPGPRDDWFTDADALVHTDWVASDRSDRVGMRLVGPPLVYREPDRQLPSEGATRGAIQVPPNGQPVLLGPDHPVTGGYPVIGVLTDADADSAAQLRPGQHVRLHWYRPRSAAGRAADW